MLFRWEFVATKNQSVLKVCPSIYRFKPSIDLNYTGQLLDVLKLQQTTLTNLVLRCIWYGLKLVVHRDLKLQFTTSILDNISLGVVHKPRGQLRERRVSQITINYVSLFFVKVTTTTMGERVKNTLKFDQVVYEWPFIYSTIIQKKLNLSDK